MKVGLSVVAQCGDFTASAGVDGLFGSEASSGVIPQLSVGYSS